MRTHPILTSNAVLNHTSLSYRHSYGLNKTIILLGVSGQDITCPDERSKEYLYAILLTNKKAFKAPPVPCNSMI